MNDLESIVTNEDTEALAPAVVVATIALLGVFMIGFLALAIRFVL
ncbi:hypothetical protein [Halorubrum pallidum]|uniref:Uncharacterized protein n=1 Tax=Halorubrum pallidum TaxID=1526114 RepID=A0ABD5SZG4_9EURY